MKRRPNLSRDLLLKIGDSRPLQGTHDQYARITLSEGKVLDWTTNAVQHELEALQEDGYIRRRGEGEYLVYQESADGMPNQLVPALLQYELMERGQQFVDAAHDLNRWREFKRLQNWPITLDQGIPLQGNDERDHLPLDQWAEQLRKLP